MSTDMKDYEEVKSGSGKKTPIVEITKSGEGAYLKGVLVAKKTIEEDAFDPKTGEKKKNVKLIATFRLIETTARMIAKGAQGYAPVAAGAVKAGDEVTIYGAPTALKNALDTIPGDGTVEVMIVYIEKKSVKKANGKSTPMHIFKVGKRAAAPVAAAASSEELPD